MLASLPFTVHSVLIILAVTRLPFTHGAPLPSGVSASAKNVNVATAESSSWSPELTVLHDTDDLFDDKDDDDQEEETLWHVKALAADEAEEDEDIDSDEEDSHEDIDEDSDAHSLELRSLVKALKTAKSAVKGASKVAKKVSSHSRTTPASKSSKVKSTVKKVSAKSLSSTNGKSKKTVARQSSLSHSRNPRLSHSSRSSPNRKSSSHGQKQSHGQRQRQSQNLAKHQGQRQQQPQPQGQRQRKSSSTTHSQPQRLRKAAGSSSRSAKNAGRHFCKRNGDSCSYTPSHSRSQHRSGSHSRSSSPPPVPPKDRKKITTAGEWRQAITRQHALRPSQPSHHDQAHISHTPASATTNTHRLTRTNAIRRPNPRSDLRPSERFAGSDSSSSSSSHRGRKATVDYSAFGSQHPPPGFIHNDETSSIRRLSHSQPLTHAALQQHEHSAGSHSQVQAHSISGAAHNTAPNHATQVSPAGHPAAVNPSHLQQSASSRQHVTSTASRQRPADQTLQRSGSSRSVASSVYEAPERPPTPDLPWDHSKSHGQNLKDRLELSKLNSEAHYAKVELDRDRFKDRQGNRDRKAKKKLDKEDRQRAQFFEESDHNVKMANLNEQLSQNAISNQNAEQTIGISRQQANTAAQQLGVARKQANIAMGAAIGKVATDTLGLVSPLSKLGLH